MKKNIGTTDRIIRFVFMDLLMGMCLWGVQIPEWLANFSFAVSLYLIFTIVVAYSPIYHLIKWNSLEESYESRP